MPRRPGGGSLATGASYAHELRLLIVFAAGACQRDGGVIGRDKVPGVAGSFVIEDDDRTVALASVQHSIFYEIGNERKLVFHGAGGDRPILMRIAPDTILVRYCGGSIYEEASPFFERPDAPAPRGNRLLRLQVITEPGVSFDGRSVC